MTNILYGRRDVLAALHDGLDGALGGRGGVALISGEPGIGKSAVAAAIARDAEARGAVVTWGRAWEFAESPPYFPLWACFRTLGIALDEEQKDDAGAFRLWERVVSALARSTPFVWM